jgi:hypothetical protein
VGVDLPQDGAPISSRTGRRPLLAPDGEGQHRAKVLNTDPLDVEARGIGGRGGNGWPASSRW